MTDEAQQFRVSRLSSRCYKFTPVGSPLRGYLLFITQIKDGRGNNYQLNLCAFVDEDVDKPQFSITHETYSMKFYARSAKQRQDVVDSILQALINDDLENPVHVALAAGGSILNEEVKMPPPVLTHLH